MEFNAGNDVPAIQIITSLKNTRVTISSMDAGQNMDFAPKYQDILKQKMSDIGKGDIADNLIAFLQNVIALDQMKQGMKGTPIYDAQTVQKFLCDLDGTASDIFPKPIPLKSVTVIDKSELVPAFLAASDAGEFAPELLDTHGKMSIEAMPNDQTSNIQFIPGLYSIDETIREDNIPAAAKMGNKRAHDLINRVTKASQKIIFT